MSKRTRYSVMGVALVTVTPFYFLGSKLVNMPSWAFVVAVVVVIGASVAQDLALHFHSPIRAGVGKVIQLATARKKVTVRPPTS